MSTSRDERCHEAAHRARAFAECVRRPSIYPGITEEQYPSGRWRDTVGDERVLERQRSRRENGGRGVWIALARQDVEGSW